MTVFCFLFNRSTKRNSRIQRERIHFVFNCGRWMLHGGSGEVCWLIINNETNPLSLWHIRHPSFLKPETWNITFRLPQLVGVCHRRRVHPAAVPVVPRMQQTVCRHKTSQRTKSHGGPNLPLLSQLLWMDKPVRRHRGWFAGLMAQNEAHECTTTAG